MLLNQLMFFGILSLFIYVLILLRRTYRKIATTVLVLLLAILVISLAGTIKFSIFDSMNLDLNPSIMDLDDNRELVGGGESILDKLKLWNKKKLNLIIRKINEIELNCKKNHEISKNITLDFLSTVCDEVNNYS